MSYSVAKNSRKNSTCAEPLQMTETPNSPWEKVSIDFCGPLPSGDYLLVVIDDYSQFPEVEILKSTSSRAVIPKLDKIFSAYGIPNVAKSENGPPFNSHEFKDFAEHMGFKHRKITQYWPQANGEAERFMRTLEKAVRAAQVQGKPWKQELYVFLRNYHATSHSSTGQSPATVLFQRSIRTKLPEIAKSTKNSDIKVNDGKAKSAMKQYADKRRQARPSPIQNGDKVLV